MVKESTDFLSRGRFRLTKWISNDRKVLESIPQSERAASGVDLALDEIPVERTLFNGMLEPTSSALKLLPRRNP